MTHFGDLFEHPRYLERRMVRFGGRPDFEQFLAEPVVSALDWPAPVLEDWLWDHGNYWPFLDAYGHIDLETVAWTREELPTEAFLTIPTDPSSTKLLTDLAGASLRFGNLVREVQAVWEQDGTWPREPILIERAFVDGEPGLQLIEGRSRVSMLRARRDEGHVLADRHAVWVGRRSA